MSISGEKLKKELAELASELIRYKTASGNRKEQVRCVEYVEEYFKDLKDLKIFNYEWEEQPALVVSTKKTKEPDIILSGHIDVVPGKDDQFTPRCKGDLLYGRGAMDMKGGVATLMRLFYDLVSSGEKLPSMALMITSDEEIGCQGSSHLAKDEEWRAKIMLVPEGARSFKLVSREKGACWIKMVSEGKSAHAAYPWLGENANEKLFGAYKKIKGLFPKPVDEWVSTVSVTKFESENLTINRIPNKAEALIDIRYTNDFALTGEEVLKKISRLVPEVSLSLVAQSNLLYVPDDNKYLKKILSIASSQIGDKVEPGFNHGSSDASSFAKFGVPAITSGVVGKNHHGDNEYVELESLVNYYNIVREFIKNFPEN